mmetsp:Transcript_7195/g.19496  ORF Transcript_7195/g.19496 Transcript_7195/m.19496 type:complete len:283 (-) Transcript_7195:220-1068(-)|eukprot:CAMPEP_0198109290 /NCGR_PEP_ID=MMETSP1442-20131203/1298_1 /TAXON_ID= /ORGANISM="Craspedostauros australis, Strain CCMP3328" /LENGTH=282 /DNA_ID=CAMNT_0043764873 /DNA_START=312 /DNA_END=1160 /DNA_ORIENTATION=-
MADDDQITEEQAQQICKIYDEDDFFTVIVQMMLALFALLSLWFKRQTEKPRRKFYTWFLDISKQGLGACYAHVLNMVIAAVIIGNIRGDGQLDDQCAWYGMSYLIDTTLGLVLAILCVQGLDRFAQEFDLASLKNSGVYEGPHGLIHWVHQVIAWILILTVVKIAIYAFMVLTSGFLADIGAYLFLPLQGNIRFELLFVMIFFPGVLNVIYFWIADSYLQAKSGHAGAHEEEPSTEMQNKKESLLTETERTTAIDPPPVGQPKQPTWTTVDGANSTPQTNVV